MRGSLERALLMAAGLSLILYALSGPVGEAVAKFEERRAINCVNTAIKAIDLAPVSYTHLTLPTTERV